MCLPRLVKKEAKIRSNNRHYMAIRASNLMRQFRNGTVHFYIENFRRGVNSGVWDPEMTVGQWFAELVRNNLYEVPYHLAFRDTGYTSTESEDSSDSEVTEETDVD